VSRCACRIAPVVAAISAGQYNSPSTDARIAAEVLLLAFNLVTALDKWKLTVRSAILRMSAISPEVLPSAV
jgi:hypothetical protein